MAKYRSEVQQFILKPKFWQEPEPRGLKRNLKNLEKYTVFAKIRAVNLAGENTGLCQFERNRSNRFRTRFGSNNDNNRQTNIAGYVMFVNNTGLVAEFSATIVMVCSDSFVKMLDSFSTIRSHSNTKVIYQSTEFPFIPTFDFKKSP